MSALTEKLEELRQQVDRLEREKCHAIQRFEELANELRGARARIAELEAEVKKLKGGAA